MIKIDGLTTASAQHLLKIHGYNELPAPAEPNILWRFIMQFKSPFIFVLLGVFAYSLYRNEVAETIVIGLILVANASIGVWQEGKAKKALLSLRELDAPTSIVIRDGEEQTLLARLLVPGDVLLLREGDRVPADAEIFGEGLLMVDESLLTGESFPVPKTASAENNILAHGALILSGRAFALVKKTGLRSTLGLISESLTLPHELPIIKKMKNLSRVVLASVIVLSALLFILGFAQGRELGVLLATIAALAVSLIPEGLPMVITLTLARGVQKLSHHHIIIRQMAAIEGLADVKAIAVDKTGTLTEGQLMVEKIITPTGQWSFLGSGLESAGSVRADESSPENELKELMTVALLTNNASLGKCDGKLCILGDPLEGAYLIAAQKLNWDAIKFISPYERISEVPFSPMIKKHLVTAETKAGDLLTALTGAPEIVLEQCETIFLNGEEKVLTAELKKSWRERQENLAEQGYRVIAYGKKINRGAWQFLGLGTLSDELREGVPEAIAACQNAGLKIIMITGDHPLTAFAIAKKAGLTNNRSQVITWDEWKQVPAHKRPETMNELTVFARTRPENKLELIQLFQAHNIPIAMTGDGVNDAPALQAANIGIAMGQHSSAVARETADLILSDNHFASIVRGIEEARNINQTLRRVSLYLFGSSVAEGILIGLSIAFNSILPLLPIQLLWINFITDSFMAFGLTYESPARQILQKKWLPSGKFLLDYQHFWRMIILSVATAVPLTGLIYWTTQQAGEFNYSLILIALVLCEWLIALSVRSNSTSIFTNSFQCNPTLFWMMILVIAIQLGALYSPISRQLHLSPLTPEQWLIALAVALPVLCADEIWKFLHRARVAKPRPQLQN